LNISNIVNNKISFLNVDLIKKEVNKILNEPQFSEFYLYPAMWTLIVSSFLAIYIFHNSKGTLLPFLFLTGLLFIQNYINYSQLLKIALRKELNNFSLSETIQSFEWVSQRETIKKLPGNTSVEEILKKDFKNFEYLSKKEIFKYNLEDDDSVFIKSNNNIYNIYSLNNNIIVDKISPIISSMFNQLYKEENLIKIGYTHIFEPLVISLSLFFGLMINL
jgi:hypothetical protein